MAATVLIQVKNNNSQTSVVDIPDGVPSHVQLAVQSPVYGTDPTLTFDLQAEQSFDGGVTFAPWFGITSQGGTAGQVFKGVVGDGLPTTTIQWDGVGCTCRVTITVNRPFSWGLSVEVLAT